MSTTSNNRTIENVQKVLGLPSIPKRFLPDERWRDYVDLLPGFSELPRTTAYAIYSNIVSIDFKRAVHITYKDAEKNRIDKLEGLPGVGFIDITLAANIGHILISKELRRAFLYKASGQSHDKVTAIAEGLIIGAGWNDASIVDCGILKRGDEVPYYQLGVTVEDEHRKARAAEYAAMRPMDERIYFVEDLIAYYSGMMDKHYRAIQEYARDHKEALADWEGDSGKGSAAIQTALNSLIKQGVKKILSAKVKDTEYEAIHRKLAALPEIKQYKRTLFTRHYPPIQEPSPELKEAEAEPKGGAEHSPIDSPSGEREIPEGTPKNTIPSNIDDAIHHISLQLQQRQSHGLPDVAAGGFDLYLNAHRSLQFLRRKGIEWVGDINLPEDEFLSNIQKIKIAVETHSDGIPLAGENRQQEYIKKIIMGELPSPVISPVSDAKTIIPSIQQSTAEIIPSEDKLEPPTSPMAGETGSPASTPDMVAEHPEPLIIESDSAVGIAGATLPSNRDAVAEGGEHIPSELKAERSDSENKSEDKQEAPSLSEDVPNAEPPVLTDEVESASTIEDNHGKGAGERQIEHVDDVPVAQDPSASHTTMSPVEGAQEPPAKTDEPTPETPLDVPISVTEPQDKSDASASPSADELPPASVRNEWKRSKAVCQWLKQNAPSLIVGASTGAAVRMGAHFALAAFVTTTPGIAVAIGSAIFVGALAGGTSKLATVSIWGGARKSENNWRYKAFMQGAVMGAIGSGVGAGATQWFISQGYFQGLAGNIEPSLLKVLKSWGINWEQASPPEPVYGPVPPVEGPAPAVGAPETVPDTGPAVSPAPPHDLAQTAPEPPPSQIEGGHETHAPEPAPESGKNAALSPAPEVEHPSKGGAPSQTEGSDSVSHVQESAPDSGLNTAPPLPHDPVQSAMKGAPQADEIHRGAVEQPSKGLPPSQAEGSDAVPHQESAPDSASNTAPPLPHDQVQPATQGTPQADEIRSDAVAQAAPAIDTEHQDMSQNDVHDALPEDQFKKLPKGIQKLAFAHSVSQKVLFFKEASFWLINSRPHDAAGLKAGAHLIQRGIELSKAAGLHNGVVQKLHADLAYMKAWGIGTDRNPTEAIVEARQAGKAIHNFGGRLLKFLKPLSNG